MPKGASVIFEVDIIVDRDGDEFHAYSPALKGLHVGGKTEQEIIQNASDAIEAYLASLIKHGDPIPLSIIKKPPTPAKESHLQRLAVSLDQFQAAHIAL